ncbi:MAG: hypothetical protein JO300_15205 [Silvibacterium sp.]|nr:hypothetical protein [Silvibacterium sp.]MBV8438794.1 hypothetical protein [Silvibacterium sp.]
MRTPLRSLDAILPGVVLLAGIGILAGARPFAAQIAPPATQTAPTAPSLPGAARPGLHGEDDNNNNPLMRQLYQQQALKRADMRQKLIVDDTAKLLTLAEQLKQEADKGTLNKSSATLTRKVEEIEKLAKTVKDKMREGQ